MINDQEQNNKSCNLMSFNDTHRDFLGYLALVKLAGRYAHTNQREISKEIGRVSMDLIEPEFAMLDKRNLIERKKFLEYEYENLEKLKKLDFYEQKFIENGKSAVETMGFTSDSLIEIGVPINTLKAARII